MSLSAIDLSARREQCGPVAQRPSVVLHVGNLDPAGAEFQRQRHHVGDTIDIGAMHDCIDGQRQFHLDRISCKCELAGEGAVIARDVVGRGRDAVLDRYLNVIEPCSHEFAQPLGVHAHPGRDEIGI